MALLSLTQPLPFLQSPGEPTISFDTWLRSFETYLTALSEKELADKRKCTLLIHCIGVEAQRIFYSLETGTSYGEATKAESQYSPFPLVLRVPVRASGVPILFWS